nr:calcium-binding protein [uncultured Celeribacter sp.]
MVQLIDTTALTSGILNHDVRFSDLDLVTTSQGCFLVATSRELQSVVTYQFDPLTGTLTYVDEAGFVCANMPPEGISIAESGALRHLAIEGQDALAGLTVTMDENGGLSRGASAGAGTLGMTMTAAEFTQVEGLGSVLVAAGAGEGTLACYQVDAAGQLTALSSFVTAPETVSALATVQIDGASFVLYATTEGDSLTCASINASGQMAKTGNFGAEDGLGINAVEDITFVTHNGTTYGVIAAAGSSSLSVVSLSPEGRMTLVDHVIDSLDTRFMNVSHVEAIVVDGECFVVAAGSDDGLSVFSLLPDGTLVHRLAIADTAELGLCNVSGFTLSAQDGVLTILATSGAEAGIQTLTLDLGLNGATLAADGSGTQVTGTTQDDVIYGSAVADDITAGAGNDLIYDGAGADVMWGGDGADSFVLAEDHAADTIMDFKPGSDRLDLSAWSDLRSLSALDYSVMATGGQISFGDETLTLVSDDGMPIYWADLNGSIDIALAHYMPDVGPGVITHPEGIDSGTLVGTSGADVLLGGAGDDVLIGMGGGDAYDGAEGEDTVDYSGSGSFVSIDLADATLNEGFSTGDSYANIEIVICTDFDDRLSGDSESNIIYGGAGSDTIYGQTGHDQLFGEAGDDRLHGGKHKDRVHGGDGDDRVYGYSGHDFLKGDDGNDLIRGHDGDDRLYGGNDDDRLEGGEGDDYLSGGRGADEFVFTEGHDEVNDLNTDMDVLILDAALWNNASLSAADVVNTYGQWDNGQFSLVFDVDNSVLLTDLADTTTLADAIEFL